jgi:hypothetical protein
MRRCRVGRKYNKWQPVLRMEKENGKEKRTIVTRIFPKRKSSSVYSDHLFLCYHCPELRNRFPSFRLYPWFVHILYFYISMPYTSYQPTLLQKWPDVKLSAPWSQSNNTLIVIILREHTKLSTKWIFDILRASKAYWRHKTSSSSYASVRTKNHDRPRLRVSREEVAAEAHIPRTTASARLTSEVGARGSGWWLRYIGRRGYCNLDNSQVSYLRNREYDT